MRSQYNFIDGRIMKIGDYQFNKVCEIRVERMHDRSIREFMPQSRYKNRKNLSLHKYGRGPYCKFKIPNYIRGCGVYALLINSSIMYVGECQDLSSRFNMGYGIISPRNCFVGGQQTNCRINNQILATAKANKQISLYFMETTNYKNIENKIRKSISPQWNRV